MKKQINEIKRMQQLAGILKENDENESLEEGVVDTFKDVLKKAKDYTNAGLKTLANIIKTGGEVALAVAQDVTGIGAAELRDKIYSEFGESALKNTDAGDELYSYYVSNTTQGERAAKGGTFKGWVGSAPPSILKAIYNELKRKINQ